MAINTDFDYQYKEGESYNMVWNFTDENGNTIDTTGYKAMTYTIKKSVNDDNVNDALFSLSLSGSTLDNSVNGTITSTYPNAIDLPVLTYVHNLYAESATEKKYLFHGKFIIKNI